jgi:hypothetical protein
MRARPGMECDPGKLSMHETAMRQKKKAVC